MNSHRSATERVSNVTVIRAHKRFINKRAFRIFSENHSQFPFIQLMNFMIPEFRKCLFFSDLALRTQIIIGHQHIHVIKYIKFSRKDIFLNLRAHPIDDLGMYVNKGHNYFAVSKPFPKAIPCMGLCVGGLLGWSLQ